MGILPMRLTGVSPVPSVSPIYVLSVVVTLTRPFGPPSPFKGEGSRGSLDAADTARRPCYYPAFFHSFLRNGAMPVASFGPISTSQPLSSVTEAASTATWPGRISLR